MASIVKWDESFSVYVKELDAQHKKLFDMINSFYDSMANNQTNQAIAKVVGEMKRYALTHFSFEESMMKFKGFPRIKSHQVSHQEFVNKVNELEDRLAKGHPVLATDIAKFLKNWIIDHIQKEDKVYANYYKNNNLI
jgi:hemerythrin